MSYFYVFPVKFSCDLTGFERSENILIKQKSVTLFMSVAVA